MTRFFAKLIPHSFSLRFALGVWFGSCLALYLAFLFQFETPQWAAVSVWIMFMQRPRLNYSKVMFWMAGTISGAILATVLTIVFAQTPELLLFTLAVWLAGCAALATQVREYRAYGAVLAGYTAAIVAFTAMDHPDRIFEIAVTRVSCISLGVACAVFAMTIFLPVHRHWPQTLHHLNEYFRAILRQANLILISKTSRAEAVSWGHVVERLSTVEHTFDFTLAESADSRARARQARSLTSALFGLAAKSEALGFHLDNTQSTHSQEALTIQNQTSRLIEKASSELEGSPSENVMQEACELRHQMTARRRCHEVTIDEKIADRFLLDQCEGMLLDVEQALQDWKGLSGPWSAPRSVKLTRHREIRLGALYALRIFVAMGLGSAFWFATQWPNGSAFLLFLAVVCSLLSLLDHAENLGLAFVKSVVACFAASFVVLFWILQNGEGFVFIAIALGFFLVPAAYAYTHPKLAGSAVISMLLFYGLVSPSNQMTYDIEVFLNNGLAFLAAATFGFFAFHVVRSPSPVRRRGMLLRAMNRDLKRGEPRGCSEAAWTSLVFDRLRILHRFALNQESSNIAVQEEMMHTGLLWGLRQISLKRLMEETPTQTLAGLIDNVLRKSGKPFHHPSVILQEVRKTIGACVSLLDPANRDFSITVVGVLSNLREMEALLVSTGGDLQ